MRAITIPLKAHKITEEYLAPPAIQPSETRAAYRYRKIALPTMEGIQFERIAKIISLEAKGNYTLIHFSDQRKIMVCKTLRSVELTLNCPNRFVRIHRSFTINLDKLEAYTKGKAAYVTMENKMSINVSASKRLDLLDALKNYFG